MELTRKNIADIKSYPTRILQFGEGNFLRAFTDWIIQNMNDKINFNAGVDVIQPLENGMINLLNEQDGLYHVYLKGIKNGEPVREFKRIDCINNGINPYTDFEIYEQTILNPVLRFVVSNTTEAGIAFDETDTLQMNLQNSFPGKVTALLYKRFKAFNGAMDKGLIFLPCELIDRNGDMLKKYVLRYSEKWELSDEFTSWVKQSCTFCNTLVDRIVPGFPKDDIKNIQAELGIEDKLVVVGEYFHFWVIEGPDWIQKEFPASEAGLQVKFVNDMTKYREQKVRVLNGAHTGSYAVSLLYGIETVRESIEHIEVGRFLKELIFDEVIKGLDGNEDDLKAFASKILERFYNPYIRHEWTSIALNALSKWETRCLPSLLDHVQNTGELPRKLVFSLAAMIAYYKGEVDGQKYTLNDDQVHLDYFSNLWSQQNGTPESIYKLSEKVLSYKSLWKKDLNEIQGLTQAVSSYLYLIEQVGMKKAIKSVLGKKQPSNKAA
ncbi:tagaturonate reductase [Sunxiuqinia sp. A32]|uniref:tagaturonate reductase n=1 Tax=Sunxiuqinia sp. A32 TaxID=3461496 RepID=UPI00404558FC